MYAAAAALTPNHRLQHSTLTPKRKLSGSLLAPSPGVSLPGLAARNHSTLFLHLLYFIAGMMFTYIILSSTQTTANVPSQALMHWFKQGASSHPSATTAAVAMAAPAALPLCGPDDYTDGEWVYDATITTPAYVSHEWDNVCDAEGASNDGGAPPPGGKKVIRPELQYVWKTRNCRMVPYSRKNFCQLLAGRNIFFVGDSIAGQHLSSFVHLMHTHPNDLWIRDEYFRHDVMSVCQDYYPADESVAKPRAGRHPESGKALAGVRVGFRRNNFLNLHTEHNATMDQIEYRKWNTNQTWVGEIEEHGYDIVVMNTGIWMVDAPIYTRMLTEISTYMRAHHPKVTLIWRSTQPGHAACHTHWARPQQRLYDIRDTTGGSARFRWEEADERNRIARSLFPNEFMDVVSATKLRPDGHMPGTKSATATCMQHAWRSVRWSHVFLPLLLSLFFR
jgi:hypothetical protein